MAKRMIGLIVACVLALFGGAAVAMPAASAAPHSATTRTQATASKADKAKAAAAAKAAVKAKAAAAKKAKAHATYLARVGRPAAAAYKAAAVAQVRAKEAARVAKKARARAAFTAKASVAATAKSTALAKNKTAPGKAKAEARRTARAAGHLAAKAAHRATAKSQLATHAKAVAAAKKKAAVSARADYVVKAGARASNAKKGAAAARVRAKVMTSAATKAHSRAAAAGRAATSAKAKAVALRKSRTTTAKAKKKANAAATAATKTATTLKARAKAGASRAHRARLSVHVKAAAAVKARRAAGRAPSYAPKTRLVFNNPRGSRRKKLAIITQINRAIDATPAGGEIRMAQYLFDLPSVANKLVAADKRGASVQVLVDDGENNRYIRRVRHQLGTDKSARSFVATCHHSCMSNRTSVIHAKFYLFSVAGTKRYVSMISSANPYTGNTFNSWNNSHTIVGDRKIYDSLSQYFTDMLRDRKDLNYFRVTSSGKYTIYLYPRAVRRPDDVVLLKVLNRTSCTTNAKGYGTKGHTLIRVANWGWSTTRLDVAQRLWHLHDQGCKVQVIVNRARISRGVLKVLLKPSKKHGRIPVYDAWYDANHNNVAGLYIHDKTLTINGKVSGKNVKVTWTGSQNFTALGTLANNDIVLRVNDASVTHAYNVNFAYIRARYTHRMHSVPAVTRVPN